MFCHIKSLRPNCHEFGKWHVFCQAEKSFKCSILGHHPQHKDHLHDRKEASRNPAYRNVLTTALYSCTSLLWQKDTTVGRPLLSLGK